MKFAAIFIVVADYDSIISFNDETITVPCDVASAVTVAVDVVIVAVVILTLHDQH